MMNVNWILLNAEDSHTTTLPKCLDVTMACSKSFGCNWVCHVCILCSWFTEFGRNKE